MSALSPRLMWRLDEACRPIRQAFHAPPYLVGTALTGKAYRDVDVRLILEDEPYDALADQIGPGGMAFLGIAIGGAFKEIEGTLSQLPGETGEPAAEEPVGEVADELAARRARRRAG